MHSKGGLLSTDAPKPLPTNWPAPVVTTAVATYRKVTSVVFLSQRSGVSVRGGLQEHAAAYKSCQVHTSLAGWWSIFGLLWTPMVLMQNKKTFRSVETLLASGKANVSWYADPSRKFDERFWDGDSWTDRVRSASSDTPPS